MTAKRRENAEVVFEQWRLNYVRKVNDQKEQKNRTREKEELKKKDEEERKEARKAEAKKVQWLVCE